MKLSITLPSIYPQALWRTLENIRDTTVNEVEILVVTPNIEPNTPTMRPGQEVVWLREKEKRGCAAAHAMAADAASGDFLVAFTDDFLFADRWDEKAIADFTERERLFDSGYVMGLRYDHFSLVGTVFGIYYANFPMMRRSSLAKFGWITPGYQRGFGDSDCGMRVWHRGGICEFSKDILLTMTEDDKRKGADVATTEDMAVFLSRWAPIFGQGWETRTLRNFNIDVTPEKMPHLLRGGRTIFHNDPEFVELSAEALAPVPELIETNGTLNIVRYKGGYYVIPQSIGPVDIALEADRSRPEIRFRRSLNAARRACTKPRQNVAAFSRISNYLKGIRRYKWL